MGLGRIFNTEDSWGLLLLRLGLGCIFMAHGAQKLFGWFGGAGFQTTIQNFQQGLNIPMELTVLAMIAEFFGGLGVLAGCLTRVAALGLCSVMIVAIVKVHLVNGFFMNWFCLEGQGHGIEFNLALLAMSACLVISGGGEASVDKWLSEQ
ncbi:DoxX family protein [Trichloromonas sp.]|uniref:DoxX family protein n=1 Tax=Trichloromonas sp. TaxID=3069249 RepID=UPI003D815E40